MGDAESTADAPRAVICETATVIAASPRPLGATLLVAGVFHLLVPGLLLSTARIGYERVLGVRFRPRSNATRRVRVVGLGMIATGAHLLYHGGVRPR